MSKVAAASWDSFPAKLEHFKRAPSREARFSWKLNPLSRGPSFPAPSQERGAGAAREPKKTVQTNLGTR